MSERLTHSQLACLEENAGPMFGAEAAKRLRFLEQENSTIADKLRDSFNRNSRLAAEIRTLCKEVEDLRDGITKVNNEGVKHRRENAKLRAALGKYGVHYASCPRTMHNVVPADVSEGTPCDCGLNSALKGAAEPAGNPSDVLRAISEHVNAIAAVSAHAPAVLERVSKIEALITQEDPCEHCGSPDDGHYRGCPHWYPPAAEPDNPQKDN